MNAFEPYAMQSIQRQSSNHMLHILKGLCSSSGTSTRHQSLRAADDDVEGNDKGALRPIQSIQESLASRMYRFGLFPVLEAAQSEYAVLILRLFWMKSAHSWSGNCVS